MDFNNVNDQILQLISQYLMKTNPEISNQLSTNVSELFSSQKLKEFVVEGRWDDLVNKLSEYKNIEIVDKSIFKIIEQKIHEILNFGNQTLALEILRNELSPLNRFPERIHQLAQSILLMRTEPIDRELLAQELIVELKKVAGLMITDNRLEELIQQALEYQKLVNCPFHIERNDQSLDLWYDHDCKIDETIVLELGHLEGKIIPIESTMDILRILISSDGTRLVVFDDNGELFNYEKIGQHEWNFSKKMTTLLDSVTIWPNIVQRYPQSHNQEQILFKTLNEPSTTEELSIEAPLSMAFMPNQNFVICSIEDQTTTLFDLKEGKPIHSWIRLRCSHILTPRREDEKYFLAASDSGNILQISTETFQVIKTIPGINDKLQISSVDLDGKRLLVGCNDSTIYYYDDWLNYSHPTRIFRGHFCKKYQIKSILSRHDRNIVISCSENGSIYLWNLSSGRLIFQIKIFPENCCVNDILEVGPRRFICCGDGGKLYQFAI